MSVRRRIAILFGASVVALGLAIAGFAGGSQNPTLIGFVGTNDGFDIGLTDASGTPITRIAPGTYTFLIRDRSHIHNFVQYTVATAKGDKAGQKQAVTNLLAYVQTQAAFFAKATGLPKQAVVNDLNAAGIRVRLRAMERATFYGAWQEKKLRGLFMTAAGNSGNAASRVDTFIQSKGAYAYGGYPDIDDLFQQQASERDVGRREALLHKIQQLTIERAMHAPVMDLRTLNGIGPRIAKHTITDVWMSPFPSYEDIELKN